MLLSHHACVLLAGTAVILQGELLRALSSWVLSLPFVITLLWGGCISCEQYFTFGKSHGCCNPDGRCKTKIPVKNGSGRECKQIAFDHEKGFVLYLDLPVVSVERIALPVPKVEHLLRRDAFPFDPSPPDLQVLHSSFLI